MYPSRAHPTHLSLWLWWVHTAEGRQLGDPGPDIWQEAEGGGRTVHSQLRGIGGHQLLQTWLEAAPLWEARSGCPGWWTHSEANPQGGPAPRRPALEAPPRRCHAR